MSKTCKKLINETERCVDDSLSGFTKLYPGLRLHKDHRYVTISKEETSSRVGILSGGGSGHEPFCTGYVGDGMLAAAVSGSIFASPPKSHIIRAIRYLNHFYKGGVLVLIPNYTGDCLNFGMAIELAKSEGIRVDAIAIGEDCASGQSNIAGKRGMCGLLFTYKIAGALAMNGSSLTNIMEKIDQVHKNMSTLGISLSPCSLPGQSQLFSIADDEMELGTGVHGEAGILKLKMSTAKQAVECILNKLCAHLELPKSASSVVVLVNNLGTSIQLEQNIICNEVHSQLAKRGVIVERLYAGMLMTSLDMAGFQISILKLTDEFKSDWIRLLDQKTEAPGWPASTFSIPFSSTTQKQIVPCVEASEYKQSKYILTNTQQDLFKQCLIRASNCIIEKEVKLNELDAGCGDGDCGTTLKHLAEGILETLVNETFECPARVFQKVAEIAEAKMGGTSGAIYSLGFTSMAKCFINSTVSSLPAVWADSFLAGVDSIMKYGRANPGDRTVVDSLKPAADRFYKMITSKTDLKLSLKESLQYAIEGCSGTKQMKARAGRASYVNEERLIDFDAGAFAFVTWYEPIVTCFQ